MCVAKEEAKDSLHSQQDLHKLKQVLIKGNPTPQEL